VAGIFDSCETFEFLWHSSIIMQKHSELFENSPMIYHGEKIRTFSNKTVLTVSENKNPMKIVFSSS